MRGHAPSESRDGSGNADFAMPATPSQEATVGLPSGLRKRGDVFYVQCKEGRTSRLKAVGSDLREALAKHKELRRKAETTTGATFDALIERWLASQETRCRPASVRASRARSGNLLKLFAGWPASMINSDAVEQYIRQRRREGVSDTTVNADLTTLRQILRFGHLQAGVLAEMPTRVRMLRVMKKHRRRTFERADVAKLIATAQKMKRPKVELFIRIAVATGLRLDEILHRWEDLDLEDRRVDVRCEGVDGTPLEPRRQTLRRPRALLAAEVAPGALGVDPQ